MSNLIHLPVPLYLFAGGSGLLVRVYSVEHMHSITRFSIHFAFGCTLHAFEASVFCYSRLTEFGEGTIIFTINGNQISGCCRRLKLECVQHISKATVAGKILDLTNLPPTSTTSSSLIHGLASLRSAGRCSRCNSRTK